MGGLRATRYPPVWRKCVASRDFAHKSDDQQLDQFRSDPHAVARTEHTAFDNCRCPRVRLTSREEEEKERARYIVPCGRKKTRNAGTSLLAIKLSEQAGFEGKNERRRKAAAT
jgi:hypothetical protein